MIGATNIELGSSGAVEEKRSPSPVRDVRQDPSEAPEEWSDFGPCKCKLRPADCSCLGGIVRVNPIVFFFSVALIMGFVIYCADDPGAGDEIQRWQDYIIDNFTWLYIASVGCFGIFDIWLVFSKYGDIVLGKEGEPPRFSTGTWFSMLFSAGIGIGLFYWGVAEPISHYRGPNRWSGLPRYERAIMAMNVSWFHWGLCPSACYAIVGLPIAFLSHRKGMPVNMRTCFYPLMGDAIYGIFGDIVDILAVMGTMFGVATSLGLGVLTISRGLSRQDDSIKDDFDTQTWIIWMVTAFATVSVVTGLDYGIRRLSEGNFLLGLFVLGTLALMGNTFFLLDMFVETMGRHIWYLMDLEFHTDVWSQLSSVPVGAYDDSTWMAAWTVFYWGWWISWAPFVGVFIAQISQGRTIREFILGNVLVPSILTSLWFTIYGGLGLQMEMQAEAMGLGGNYHLLMSETFTSGTTTYDPVRYDYAYNRAICCIPDCDPDDGTPVLHSFPIQSGKIYRLSCRNYQDQLWDVIEAHNLEKFMSWLTLIAVVTYFVTSSDSGSHVIDMLCANGEEEPPMVQRIFWAIAEGAVAWSLLDAGGSEALSALQTASIAAGLPFCIIMIGMTFSSYQMLSDWAKENPDGPPEHIIKDEMGNPLPEPVRWNYRLLRSVDDTMNGALFCCCKNDSRRNTVELLQAIFLPFTIANQANQKSGLQSRTPWVGGFFFFLWVLFECLEAAEPGLGHIGWMMYFCFCGIMGMDRSNFRENFGLSGNSGQDCCQMMFCYPFAVLQQLTEAEELCTETKEP